jgi:hypothetical protein
VGASHSAAVAKLHLIFDRQDKNPTARHQVLSLASEPTLIGIRASNDLTNSKSIILAESKWNAQQPARRARVGHDITNVCAIRPNLKLSEFPVHQWLIHFTATLTNTLR